MRLFLGVGRVEMRRLNACTFLIALAVGGMLPMAAHALTITQEATITFDGIAGSGVSSADMTIGEAQLSVIVSEVADDATKVSFTFKNIGQYASAIAEIYFDDDENDPLLEAIASIVGSSSDVEFSDGGNNGVNPSNLPGGENLTPDFVATESLSTEADNPESKYGVGPGDYVIITFDLVSSVTYEDILNALASGDLRIGLHVVSFPDGKSASFVNNPYGENGGADPTEVVPEPGSLVLLGSVLLGLAGFRLKGKLGLK